MRHGYAPIIIKNENRSAYYEVLDKAHTTQNYSQFLEMVVALEVESQELWLSLAE